MGRVISSLLLSAVLLSGAGAGPAAHPSGFSSDPSAPSTTIIVSTGSDLVNPSDGKCSLREAVIAANTDTASGGIAGECPAGSGVDTIILGIRTHNLTLNGTDNTAAAGDLDILESVNIYGLGAQLSTIDAIVNDRVFDVLDTGSYTLRLADLKVRGGSLDTGNYGGAGVRLLAGRLEAENVVFESNFVAGSDSGDAGGALEIKGSLELEECTFYLNYANRGGAIFLAGTVTDASIQRSLFLLNTAQAGGAINNYGAVIVINTTFSGNQALNAAGGAITNHGTMILGFSTLADNSASSSYAHAGAIFNFSDGTTLLRSNILARNSVDSGSHDNCNDGGTWVSSTYNLEDKATCPLGVDNTYNTDPKLAPLGNWGGPTQTYALYQNSPAIDEGVNLGCPDLDQRGVDRPVDGDGTGGAQCDIGAFELDWENHAIYLPLIGK